MVNIINNFSIDHVIIPIRSLDSVTKSRENTLFWDGKKAIQPEDNGGDYSFDDQKCFNGELMYNLIFTLTKNNINYTTIPFPNYCNENSLLYKKLGWLFKYYNVNEEEVNEVIGKLYDKNKINF